MNRTCSGCGVPLQSEDEAKPGYVPESALSREVVTCRRCYRITHYGELSPAGLAPHAFRDLLRSLGRRHAAFLCVVDTFDFHGSWLGYLPDMIPGRPLVIAANKADLLPPRTNRERVLDWLYSELERRHAPNAEVVLCSATTGEGMKDLRQMLADFSGRVDEIYAVGAANVGKSSLLNALSAGQGHLTVSRYPGTTLGLVSVPVQGVETPVLDTPGLITHSRLFDRVCADCLQTITPDRDIHPRVYQLEPGQTLFLGGVCRFDFVEGEPQSFVCYVSNGLTVHRTKLANAERIAETHVGDTLTPPCMKCPSSLRRLTPKTVRMRAGQAADIVISGLGWISVRGKACVAEVHVPEGVDVAVRRAVI